MEHNLGKPKNRHRGQTIFVLGSGPSLGFVDPDFFIDKIVVGVNQVTEFFPVRPQFVFSHHWPAIADLAVRAKKTTFVVNDRNWPDMVRWKDNIPRNVLLHKPRDYRNSQRAFDPFSQKDDPRHNNLMFGSSSAHGAIHLAAALGARHIMLVGVDNASIDGKWNFDTYPSPANLYPTETYEAHLRLVKDWIYRRFGTPIYSLNPFLNLRAEGQLVETGSE